MSKRKKKYNPTKILGLVAVAAGIFYLIKGKKNDTSATKTNS